jgi:two-component system, chemotaxis family, response regulator Rcp1
VSAGNEFGVNAVARRRAYMTNVVRPVELLLVEESATEIMLTREALLDAKIINNLHVVENDDDALAYLRREPPFTDARAPDLILLDYELSGRSGHRVLQAMKDDPSLPRHPLVVLATPADLDEARRCFGELADCYMAKPADPNTFMGAIRSMEQFWLCIVALRRDLTQ